MSIDTKLTQAIGAYTNTANMKGKLETPYLPDEGPNMHKPEFSELVSEGLHKAKGAGYLGESQSALAVANEAELHELVTAVTNAELTLRTVVALRDRVISAYQDITKMPV